MIEQHINLKPYNTFGLNCEASQFASFKTVDELRTILQTKTGQEENLFVLGGGSNILLTKNYSGLVLKNEIRGIDVVQETKTDVYVKSGAGETWHELVLYAIENNLGGIEISHSFRAVSVLLQCKT